MISLKTTIKEEPLYLEEGTDIYIKEEPLEYSPSDVKPEQQYEDSIEWNDLTIKNEDIDEKCDLTNNCKIENHLNDCDLFNYETSDIIDTKETKIFHCFKCEDIVSDQCSLNDHKRLNNHNLDKEQTETLKCNSSAASFKEKTVLNKDIFQTAEATYKCSKCEYKTTQKGHLNRHQIIHKKPHEKIRFTCDICKKSFSQKCTLRRHIQFNHEHNTTDVSLSNRIHKCTLCLYSASRKDLLNSHMDKHKKPNEISQMYFCNECGFGTKYRRNLREHLKLHTQRELMKVYKCDLCSFETNFRYCLTRHLRTRLHLLRAGNFKDYIPRRN